jgi:hypothetical protein
MLRERELVEFRSGKIRSVRSHYVAEGRDERLSLSVEFCSLFVKGLLDKLALPDVQTGTYLRKHYLHVEPDQLEEFQKQLDAAVTGLVDKFAADASPRNPMLNVLITSTLS